MVTLLKRLPLLTVVPTGKVSKLVVLLVTVMRKHQEKIVAQTENALMIAYAVKVAILMAE
ncbi:MAG: hypothetical protein QW566_02845 [Candidatus Jordarchaeales archaeon]